MRLEVVDARVDQEDIVPPPCDNRVPSDAGMPVPLEEQQIALAHLPDIVFAGGFGGADERIFNAGRVPASVMDAFYPPVPALARRALHPLVVVVPEELEVDGHVDFRHPYIPPVLHTQGMYLNEDGYLNGLRQISYPLPQFPIVPFT